MNTVATIILLCSITINVNPYRIDKRQVENTFAPVQVKMAQESFECGKELALEVMGMKVPNHYGILKETNPATEKVWGCIWKRLQLIDEDSVLNQENIENHFIDTMKAAVHDSLIDKQSMKFIVERCKNFRGSNHGATAIKVQNCITERIALFAFFEKVFQSSMFN
ncbi:hypothetical protein PPYR_01573 [Photinus pyralis]|uniref:Uncharacterized protein n=1 Tax=Photinus pyralis TaxID=7054 RepID=A0A5N4B4X7_PHOPY|nr:uncharacterized protein LOC116180662 isoform X2 [Photinus pyralis]KAB0804603.1 hypothetical protein PPYR_01573 [Photinus pyralis]